MLWTTQQCACPEPLPALRRPRAAKTAFMARSGGGISRLLPHSLVSGRDVTDVLFQMSPILHALDDGDDPHEVQSVQVCMFY